MQIKLCRDITCTINASLCSVRNVFTVLRIFLHIIFSRWQYCNINKASCTQRVAFTKSSYFRMLERAIIITELIRLAMGNVCFLYMQLIVQHWHISFRLICKIYFQHGENSYTGVMGAYWQKSWSRHLKCERCPMQVLYLFQIELHYLYYFYIKLY